jgi:hypothetical protein
VRGLDPRRGTAGYVARRGTGFVVGAFASPTSHCAPVNSDLASDRRFVCPGDIRRFGSADDDRPRRGGLTRLDPQNMLRSRLELHGIGVRRGDVGNKAVGEALIAPVHRASDRTHASISRRSESPGLTAGGADAVVGREVAAPVWIGCKRHFAQSRSSYVSAFHRRTLRVQ